MNNVHPRMIALAVASACAASPALGQRPMADESAALVEVVVTARRRSEDLQTVPLAVTALSAETLERAGAVGLADIARLTPGLSFNDVAGSLYSMPVIRGLTQVLRFTDSNRVGVFLDGVYLSNRQALNLQMLDIARVEVLKGPQSTLYGQSTFAGAINYVTREPTEAGDAEVSGSVGSDGWRDARGVLGGAVGTGKLAARIAASYREFEGTRANLADPDENLGGGTARTASASLRWSPSEAFAAILQAYWSEDEADHAPLYWVANNCGVGAGSVPTAFCGDLPADRASDISPEAYGSNVRNQIGRLQIDWRLTDRLSLANLAAITRSRGNNLTDSDGSSRGIAFPVVASNGAMRTVLANMWFAFGNQSDDAISEELRLSYDGERVDWMVGAYYFDLEGSRSTSQSVDSSMLAPGERYGNTTGVNFGTPDPFNRPVVNSATETGTRMTAGFAQIGLQITSKVRSNLELRYTDETKTQRILINARQPSNQFDRGTWRYSSPRISIDYQPRESSMLYASVAEGTSPGGFNNLISPNAPQEKQYEEETNRTYEIGAKSRWLDGRLLSNVSLFYSELENVQITRRSADPTFLFALAGNLGDATAPGGEIEIEAVLGKRTRLGFGYAYTDPKLGSDQIELGANGCGTGTLICRRRPNGDVDISGNRLPFSHRHQLSARVDTGGKFGSRWEWYGQADASYRSKGFVDTTNLTTFGEYTTVSLFVGVRNDRLDVGVWARNLFDEDFVSTAYYQNRANGQRIVEVVPGEQRMIGLTAKVRFE
jgi:iron complex outermembrane receptor protein